MNKKTAIIIAIIVVVLAVAGAAIAFAMNQNNKSSNNQSNSSKESSKTDTSKTFSPKDISKLSYVATSTMTVSGQTVTSTIENDGKGTQKTSSTTAGMTTESYITGNTVITCVDGTCTKTSVDPSSESSNQLANNAAQYRDTAKNTGSETIDGKTYQVWKATGPAGEVSYYIDSENRIGRIVLASGATTIYDYKDVSITVPQV